MKLRLKVKLIPSREGAKSMLWLRTGLKPKPLFGQVQKVVTADDHPHEADQTPVLKFGELYKWGSKYEFPKVWSLSALFRKTKGPTPYKPLKSMFF
mgnify:FL=1